MYPKEIWRFSSGLEECWTTLFWYLTGRHEVEAYGLRIVLYRESFLLGIVWLFHVRGGLMGSSSLHCSGLHRKMQSSGRFAHLCLLFYSTSFDFFQCKTHFFLKIHAPWLFMAECYFLSRHFMLIMILWLVDLIKIW